MSYTVCNVLDLGEVYTGVTLNAQLYSSSNGTVGSAITTGFYERAGAKGIYTFTLAVPDAHQGWCDIYVQDASSTVLATLPLNPAELENANVRISDLNNLSQSQAQTAASAALTAYGAATATNVSSTQTAITNAIAALNDLSGSDIVTALQAMDIETGHTFQMVLQRIYALLRNNSEADDPTNPTAADYYAPDGVTVRVHHDLTDTTRTVS